MELATWSHKYRYTLTVNRHIDRVGSIVTGTMQVDSAFSEQEIEAFAKGLYHGALNDAKLVNARLIEVQS